MSLYIIYPLMIFIQFSCKFDDFLREGMGALEHLQQDYLKQTLYFSI